MTEDDDDGGPDLRMLHEKPWPESPSIRYLIAQAVRRDALCNRNAPACEGFVEVRDERGKLIRYEHGPNCLLERLDDAIAAHSLIQRALDIHFLTASGFHMTPDDVDVEEAFVIRVLKSELDKYSQEQSKSTTHGR